ncbi:MULTISPECIES: hypothetical protein [Peribacillus]|uniref:hypothetical protein n=1 Tax=Peribacillus TaxID=2675229 RepID=UPI00159574D4|nr:hypothetical protein [Peribacillus simplex]
MKFAPQSRTPYVKLLIFDNYLSFSIFLCLSIYVKIQSLFSNSERVLSTKLFQYRLFCNYLSLWNQVAFHSRHSLSAGGPGASSALFAPVGSPLDTLFPQESRTFRSNQLEIFTNNKNCEHRVRNGFLPNARQAITGDKHDLK